MKPVTASEGIDLLSVLGVRVLVKDAGAVTLTLNGRQTEARVHVRRSSPSRWDIHRDVEDDRARNAAPGILLYVIPKASARMVEVAQADSRIAIVSVHDRFAILERTRLEPSFLGADSFAHEPAATRGRVAWGRFALMRVLLRTSHPRTQIGLAVECGVSQVAISNGLRALDTAVVRTQNGWCALRPETLWEQFLAEYPGPQGISSFWLGLDSIVRQAQTVRQVAPELDILVSGDPAGDQLAPWRVARRAVVYAHTGLDLAECGFSETSRENATLEYVVPADPTIWSTARAWTAAASSGMVDPVLVAWDVQRTGGPDAADAVERIRRQVLASWLL